jgi:hypothetical protein
MLACYDGSFVLTHLPTDSTTAVGPGNTTSVWLAGQKVDPRSSIPIGVQIARAAHAIGVDALSPAAIANGTDPNISGYVGFTSKEMIDEAHKFGINVLPWTVRLHQASFSGKRLADG